MKINVIKHRNIWFAISGILFIVSLMGFFGIGLKYGIDFTGGSLIELEFAQGQNVTVEQMNTALKKAEDKVNADVKNQVKTLSLNENRNSTAQATGSGAVTGDTDEGVALPKATVDIGTPVIVPTNTGMTIRLKALDPYTHEEIRQTLATDFPGINEKKFTTIGPTVGESLRQKALLSLSVTLIGMILFIAFAFRKVPKKISPWKFGVCAVIALLHDVIIPVGVFVLLGQLLHVEVESFFVTALLTVMGFSVHDTIVVFDRIRENLTYQKREETFADVAEKSVHQTFARSINTSLTAMITLLFLFLFGSETTRWFVFTMLIGIGIGTYSSIFIASPLLVAWKERGTK